LEGVQPKVEEEVEDNKLEGKLNTKYKEE